MRAPMWSANQHARSATLAFGYSRQRAALPCHD
jgi:hypothetical protein